MYFGKHLTYTVLMDFVLLCVTLLMLTLLSSELCIFLLFSNIINMCSIHVKGIHLFLKVILVYLSVYGL